VLHESKKRQKKKAEKTAVRRIISKDDSIRQPAEKGYESVLLQREKKKGKEGIIARRNNQKRVFGWQKNQTSEKKK